MRELGGENARDFLEKLAADGGGADEDLRTAAAEALSQLKLAEAADRQEAGLDEALRRDQTRLQLRKEKAEVFRTYVARESVASLVGGLLLIGLGAAIVVAMFTKVETTEVVTNAFLLILGYFFGQSVGRVEADRTAPDKDSGRAV